MSGTKAVCEWDSDRILVNEKHGRADIDQFVCVWCKGIDWYNWIPENKQQTC